MESKNEILNVSNTVKWIGALDYDIVSFDVVISTDYGTNYNSFFIEIICFFNFGKSVLITSHVSSKSTPKY